MKPQTTYSQKLKALAMLGIVLFSTSFASAQMVRTGTHVSVGSSFSGSSDLRGPGISGGEMKASYFDFSASWGDKLGADTLVSVGVKHELCDFDLQGMLPLPGKLTETALALGLQHKLDAQWSLIAMASPGYRSAGNSTDSRAFSVPLALGASYVKSRDLIFAFGAYYNKFSEYQALPYGMVIWNFAPQWTLSTGYPRTGLTYQATKEFAVALNVSGKGGSFWVKETPGFVSLTYVGAPPPPPTYRNTYVDYREIRVGLNLEYKIAEGVELSCEAGLVTDRKFEFHRVDAVYDTDGAAFASVGVKCSF